VVTVYDMRICASSIRFYNAAFIGYGCDACRFVSETATPDAGTSQIEAKRRRCDNAHGSDLSDSMTSSPRSSPDSEEPVCKKPRSASAAAEAPGLWAGLVQPVWDWLRAFVSRDGLTEGDRAEPIEVDLSQSTYPSNIDGSPPAPPASSVCCVDGSRQANGSSDSMEPVLSQQEKVLARTFTLPCYTTEY
jgi:hypothetical protein